VPRQCHHALDEIDQGEDVAVRPGPSAEQPPGVADPVSGLVDVTSVDEEHALDGEGQGGSPRGADALGEVDVVRRASQGGRPLAGKLVDERKLGAGEELECGYAGLPGQADSLLGGRAGAGQVAPT
jgi:hypothetical protein